MAALATLTTVRATQRGLMLCTHAHTLATGLDCETSTVVSNASLVFPDASVRSAVLTGTLAPSLEDGIPEGATVEFAARVVDGHLPFWLDDALVIECDRRRPAPRRRASSSPHAPERARRPDAAVCAST